jgi:hypothetical protein
MVVLSLYFAFQGGIVNDARLAKAVDFDSSLQQITDFSSDVTKLSGVEFSVAKNIQDLKVDVFVDKRPLSETLDKVAKVLNCQWVQKDKGYQLEMDVPAANRERNFVQAENDLRLDELKLKLWACQYVASKLPFTNEPEPFKPLDSKSSTGKEINDQIIAEFRAKQAKERDFMARITKEFDDELKAAVNANDEARKNQAIRQIAALSFGYRESSIGRVLLQFSTRETEDFWKGVPFLASTISGVNLRLYQSDFDQSPGSNSTGPDGRPIEKEKRHFVFFRYNPANGNFRANELQFDFNPAKPEQSLGGSQGGGMFSSTQSYVNVDPSLKRLPFYTQLEPWMKIKETPAKFPQAIDINTPEWDSPWGKKLFRVGDHLRWLHRATGIPIVSQADRSALPDYSSFNRTSPKLNRGKATAMLDLRMLMDEYQCLAKEDSGFLLTRNFGYWSRRGNEMPESIWKKVEPKDADPLPTIDQAFAIAKLFNEPQLSNRETNYPVSHLNLLQINECLDSLKLYATFSKQQQEIAANEDGIGFSELNASQREQMLTTALNAILERPGCTYELAKGLALNGFGLDQLSGVRFTAKWKPRVSNFAVVNTPNGTKVVEKPAGDELKRQTLWFTFSLSKQEGFTQFIDFKK